MQNKFCRKNIFYVIRHAPVTCKTDFPFTAPTAPAAPTAALGREAATKIVVAKICFKIRSYARLTYKIDSADIPVTNPTAPTDPTAAFGRETANIFKFCVCLNLL